MIRVPVALARAVLRVIRKVSATEYGPRRRQPIAVGRPTDVEIRPVEVRALVVALDLAQRRGRTGGGAFSAARRGGLSERENRGRFRDSLSRLARLSVQYDQKVQPLLVEKGSGEWEFSPVVWEMVAGRKAGEFAKVPPAVLDLKPRRAARQIAVAAYLRLHYTGRPVVLTPQDWGKEVGIQLSAEVMADAQDCGLAIVTEDGTIEPTREIVDEYADLMARRAKLKEREDGTSREARADTRGTRGRRDRAKRRASRHGLAVAREGGRS